MTIGETFIPFKKFTKVSYIPNGLLKYQKISNTAKLCWGRLAQYAGPNGKCYPSQKSLSAELGISVSQVKRVLKELEEQRFIRKNHPRGNDRFAHKTVRYEFIWHEIFDNDSNGSVKETSGGSVDDTPRKLTGDTSRDIVNELSKEKENIKKKEKNEGDAVKNTALPLLSSLSLAEIKKKAEKEVDESILNSTKKDIERMTICCNGYPMCPEFIKCPEVAKINSLKFKECPKLYKIVFEDNTRDRERMINNKINELKEIEENKITDPTIKSRLIINHFIESVKTKKGIDYILAKPRDIDAVIKYISRSHKSNYKKLINFYLTPSKCNKSENEVSLSACLSEHTTNAYNLDIKMNGGY